SLYEDKKVIKNNKSNESKGIKIYKTQTSNVHTFNFSIQPKNATDEEQHAYETKQIDFEITEEQHAYETKQIDFEITEGSQFQV
ncbi:4486_t:CDS:2, partial [Dentiscutata erythropus]